MVLAQCLDVGLMERSLIMNLKEIEYAGFRSWPALEESEVDGMVFRYSNGYTKRANSVNVLSQKNVNYSTLVAQCEEYFEGKGVPCIFRMPSFCDNKAFDTHLDGLGYKFQGRSLVLYRSLEFSTFDRAEIVVKSCEEWMASFCRINAVDVRNHHAHLEILKRIKDKVLMVVLVEESVEVACGIGVISNGYFGLFDLVTEKSARNKGYALKLLNGMLSWAVSNGATNAYLQVVADNKPAINLYTKLGYKPCYEYWYRIGR